jgi:hypothetical protein
MTIPVATVPKFAVQYRSAWASAWVDWTAVEFQSASEGAGQMVGEAQLVHRYGSVRQPGATPGSQPAAESPLATGSWLGVYVRILVQEVGGSVTIDGSPFNPLWHGTVIGIATDDQGATGVDVIRCAGIAQVLHQVTISNGLEEGASGVISWTGLHPAFNAEPIGNRSVSTFGSTAPYYVFKRHVPGVPWTALDAVRYLLAVHTIARTPYTTTPAGTATWSVSDPDGCLGFELANHAIDGMTTLEAINSIINIRRGLIWSATVTAGNVCQIVVRSIVASAVAGGTYTLPANTLASAVDLSGLAITDVSRQVLADQLYDYIEVIGERPWVALTLHWKQDQSGKSLVNGWTGADYANWTSAPGASTENVWRRFEVPAAWDGTTYNSAGVGIQQTSAADGTRSLVAALVTRCLETTRDLPIASGFGTGTTGPHQLPIAAYKNPSDGKWYSLTDQGQKEPTAYTFGLAVLDDPPAIMVGNGPSDSQSIFKLLNVSGAELVATIGVREPDPLRVSWTRTSPSPRDASRVLTVRVPTQSWGAYAGTVYGVTAAGALQTLGSDTISATTVDKLRKHLALLRAFYEFPAYTVSWTERGTCEHATTRAPGALVTTITSPAHGTLTYNVVVTRRSWAVTGSMLTTSYDTARPVPDLAAIL